MRIAIVGGGASGLAAAWSLDAAHDVVLFERESVLGGHIRTLGGNVACPALPPGVRLDAGVIEFDRTHFPAFGAFMDVLGVATEAPADVGATCLYRADGRVLRSPAARVHEHDHLVDRLVDVAQVLPSVLRLRRFLREAETLDEERLASVAMRDLLDDGDFGTWVRSLLMYAYSTSYDRVADLSGALAVPMLRDFLRPNRWSRIPGGVYGYVERLASQLRGSVRLDARILRLRRGPDEVQLEHVDGSVERFDRVVLAVPPHRALALLEDPSEVERACFGAFRGGTATTIVHTDTGPYQRRGAGFYTEFDLFELPDGGHGYNAYLNRLAGLPTDVPPHYSLAFGLESEIAPAAILHRQVHDVAYYTADALTHRAELVRLGGSRRTHYAGAFLGDGLHEGAIRSGLAVGAELGGRIV